MFLHHPLLFRPRHWQHVHPLVPALWKSQFASGQFPVDGWDAANVMLGHGVSYPVSRSMSADGQ
jgi:hypothetical protein